MTAVTNPIISGSVQLTSDQSLAGATGVAGVTASGAVIGASGGQVVAARQGTKVPSPAIGGSGLSLADITALSGSPTITLETGPNGQPAIKVVTTVGAFAEVQFPGLVGQQFHGDAYVLMHGSYTQTNVDFVTWYWSQDNTAYTNGGNQVLQYALAAPQDTYLEQGGANTYWFRKGRHTPFGTPTYPGYIGQAKLRITPRAATAATVWIYGVGVAAPARKSRMCVIWDDGYTSMFQSGYDSFATRGIAQTLAVIGSAQDTGAGYSFTRQLQAFVQAGNALVAHGPWPASGAGNLWTAYGGTGAANAIENAIADMNLNRDWLRSRGLLVPGAEACYVWPQGAFQRSVNDTALLDAALAAGYTTARSVSAIATSTLYGSGTNFDALSKYNRLALPILGHSWAGSTAAEATNISNITTAISNVAASRGDACLMLHRAVPSNTADGSMATTSIRVSDLETIAAAIKTQIDAGTMDAVTMPQLAANSWWAQ